MPVNETPRGTVVICTYNRLKHGFADTLSRVMRAAEACEYDVLVVDDGSSDGTAGVAAAAGARVVRHAVNSGIGAARRTGCREAGGSTLVFIDDDCAPVDGWLEMLVAPLDQPGVVAVGGRIESVPHTVAQRYQVAMGYGNPLPAQRAPGGTPTRRVLHHFARMYRPPVLVDGGAAADLAAANVAYRREAVEAVGGFDARLQAAEDMDLAGRLRRHYGPESLRVATRATVRHTMRPGVGDLVRTSFRRARWTLAVSRKAASPPPIFPLPIAVALGWLVGGALTRSTRVLPWMVVSPLLGYNWWLARPGLSIADRLRFCYLQLACETATNWGLLRAAASDPAVCAVEHPEISSALLGVDQD